MTQHAILTAIGADRPGLVEEVSQFIFDRGGNIEDSRMVNLRGQFAIMLLVGASEAVVARLKAELPELSRQSKLHIELHAAEASRVSASAQAVPYRLSGTGVDQAGLVHRVSHVLRESNVNIESLETRLTAAPYTGSPLFEMEMIVSVPRVTPISQLRQKLGILCDELNIDWKLEPA